MNNIFGDHKISYNEDYNISTLMTANEIAEYLKIGKNRTYELLNYYAQIKSKPLELAQYGISHGCDIYSFATLI